MLVHITINGINYEEDSSSTILEAAKDHGIKIPTLCYLKRDDCMLEYKPAQCRVCVVEVEGRRNLVPACATKVEDGMVIHTNSLRVRSERKAIVELLLSNHPNDCLKCDKNRKCSLQDLAEELGIQRTNFDGPLSQENKEVVKGSLVRNPSKCVLCSRCVAMCEEVQSIGAISRSQRGFATIISDSSKCVNCGQCVQVCPTGALLQLDNSREVDRLLNDGEHYCVVQTAPAVRVALGEAFDFAPGTDMTKKMITALRMIGFKKVFDTNFSADLTIMEEATELLERLKEGKNLPLITSCCPGWIKFIETQYPEMLNLPSSCKSPQEMFSAISKTYLAQKLGIDPKKMVVVSIMPCVAKKQEVKREEERFDDFQPTDFSMSTKELAAMLKRFGIDIASLEDGEYDAPLGASTGAADIFANSGGVMEAAVRTAGMWLEGDYPKNINWDSQFAGGGIRETTVTVGGTELNLCIVSGLGNARKVLEDIKAGKKDYHFVEVMACPGGCINGGGQPTVRSSKHLETLQMRRKGIQDIDKGKTLSVSCDNPEVQALYDEFLEKPGSELAHKLLHTSYHDASEE